MPGGAVRLRSSDCAVYAPLSTREGPEIGDLSKEDKQGKDVVKKNQSITCSHCQYAAVFSEAEHPRQDLRRQLGIPMGRLLRPLPLRHHLRSPP